jgi:hypothetical protein
MDVAEVSIERWDRFDTAARARFASTYESSFPASERDATDALLTSIEAGDRTCDIALLDGDNVGLAVTRPLTVPGTEALEYLVLTDGCGVISRLFRVGNYATVRTAPRIALWCSLR